MHDVSTHSGKPKSMICGGREFRWGERTYLMGVINLTPDSFSGDGLAGRSQKAVELAQAFEAQGVDIIDVGGESTRPGHDPITPKEEMERLLPVLEQIVSAVGVPVSVDTHRAEVARGALEAGASMINDVWGLKAEAELASVAAQGKVPMVLMHNQPTTQYRDMFPEVMASLDVSVERALRAGLSPEDIILDPGIGFGKTADHNLELLGRLSEIRALGYPLLVGTSRKSTIGLVLDLPVEERLEGTAATVALAIAGGADLVRVHDVREMFRVVRMSDAIVRGWRPQGWKR